MWLLNTPGRRAGALVLLVLATAALNLVTAGIVSSHWNSSFGYAYADALIASAGVLFVLYHWVAALGLFALLIAYQLDQNGDNGKDFAAYVGGVLVTGLLFTAVDFIWRSEEDNKRGYMTLRTTSNHSH